MPTAWFFAPYKRRDRPHGPGRYCSVDDFTTLVAADGGAWSECECLGDSAVVKVRASQATLDAINAAPGVLRVPLALLDSTLASLTLAQRNAVRNKILALGYTAAEVNAALPADLSSVTLRQVLAFALTRRLEPRWDQPTDTIVLDGPPVFCRALAEADSAA